jgi:membrane-associated phospholipid phosphatase
VGTAVEEAAAAPRVRTAIPGIEEGVAEPRPAPRPAAIPAVRRALRMEAAAGDLDRGYLPSDLIVLAYLAVTGLLILFSAEIWRNHAGYIALHFVYLAAVASLTLVRRAGSPLLSFFRMTYPLWSLPFLYKSVQYLNRITTLDYFDNLIVEHEALLFNCQPSQILQDILPWPLLSEFLHFTYLFYILIFPIVGFTFYFTRRYESLKVFTSTIMLTFLSCYMIFTFFPVQGPFHHFGPLVPMGDGLVFQPLVHRLLGHASSVGTAFPSSHVAASVAAWFVCRRYMRRLSWLVFVIAAGIVIGTVYGGFHYAIDALAGLIIGSAGGVLGPRLHGWIERRIAGRAARVA